MVSCQCRTAKRRATLVSSVAVLLLLLAACYGHVKRHSQVSETPAVATQPVPRAAEPAAPRPVETEARSAPTPRTTTLPPQENAEPPAPAAPQRAEPSRAPPTSAPTPKAAPTHPAKPNARSSVKPAPGSKVSSETGTTSATPNAKTAAVQPLDLNRLRQELKATRAIGLLSKLTLKNQMDDLLDRFRRYHRGETTSTMTDLRRSYDLLVMKLLSLVQDKDQKLASDIVSSREAIWGLLSDPTKFASLKV
jgi:outer membrane biosynthesis protein TonB